MMIILLAMVLDWAELHQTELLAAWDMCQNKQISDAIKKSGEWVLK